MGTTNETTNVTTVKDICSVHKRQLCFSKEAILRVDETEAFEQNETFCSFPPLDRVQPADCWEATVRSSPGANPSVRPSCSGALTDLLLHHTGDDLGHSVHREDREGVPPRADPEVPTSLSDGLQELLSNCKQTGVQSTVPTGVPALHRDRVQQSAKDRLRVSMGGGRLRRQEVGRGAQHLPAEQLRHLSRRPEAETGSGSLHRGPAGLRGRAPEDPSEGEPNGAKENLRRWQWAGSRETNQQRGWRWLQVGIKQQRASVHRGSRGFQLGLQC